MLRITTAISLLLAGTISAWAAESVGAQYEKEFETSGQVVDILCELTGNCPKNCGGGKRLLGLKTSDGALLPIVKGAPIFANATDSFVPFCGKVIHADGLLIENPKVTIFYPQRYREKAADEWKDTDGFEEVWTAKNGKSDEWFRNDPAVKATLGDRGVLGIKGLEPKKP